MFRKNDLPELLAPAGDRGALLAAVAAGADAVYVGGKSFGARAFAKNFDIAELEDAVEYCHLHGVKLYVTVNTLVFDREMDELVAYARELWRIGVDAIITADLGAIRAIRAALPELEIHASTQMSVHSTDGAIAAEAVGCSRVVPARELSLENIKRMVNDAPTEVEVFLHGALCVCHSGQCLMSSMVGGRSGNRGECAQPCRLPYNGGRAVLSLRDLSYADHVTELIESGVASLKIEGRMKSPDYVYTVVSTYRALLDEHRNATAKENDRLAKVFSRGGFTDGYLTGKTKDGMTGVRSRRDKENSREIEDRTFEPQRVSVRASVEIKLGAPSKMTLTSGTRTVTVFGAEPVAAINAPLDSDGVKARLSKMGNTYLSLMPEDIDLALDDGVNLAPSALNALRRDAASALQSCKREMPTSATPCNENKGKTPTKKRKSAVFYDPSAYFGALKRRPELISGLDMVFLPLVKLSEIDTPTNGVYLPPIVFDTEWERIEPLLADAKARGVKYALVGNIGHIAPVRRAGLIPVGDFRLNVTNGLALAEYSELGVDEMILSAELTAPMARDIGGGVITCGRIPLMITERCFIRDVADCDRCAQSSVTLTDRTGARFPMRREWEHRTLIFSSTITYMGDKREELRRAGLPWEHFIFSSESADEIVDILTRYNKGAPLSGAVRRIGKR